MPDKNFQLFIKYQYNTTVPKCNKKLLFGTELPCRSQKNAAGERKSKGMNIIQTPDVAASDFPGFASARI
jgi:hypothetical protein